MRGDFVRFSTGLCVFLTLTSSLFADATVVLRKGTQIKIRLNETVSSGQARIGQAVEFSVVDDMKVGDTVVIPKGSLAKGFVSDAMSGKMMGAPRLSIYVGSVANVDGPSIPVTGICSAEAPPQSVGQEISIPAGTETTVEVQI